MPATAKTQTIGGQQVNTAEMTGFNYSKMYAAIEVASTFYVVKPSMNSAEIQAVIDAASVLGGGPVLVDPKAVYTLDAGITIKRGVDFGNDGYFNVRNREVSQYGLTRFVLAPGFTGAAITLAADGEGAQLRGIHLDATNQVSGSGIVADGSGTSSANRNNTVVKCCMVSSAAQFCFRFKRGLGGLRVSDIYGYNGGSNNIEIEQDVVDSIFERMFSSDSAGTGIYSQSDSSRYYVVDSWSNAESGTVLDGGNNCVYRLQTDLNKKEGLWVKNTRNKKRNNFYGITTLTNSEGNAGLYSEVKIDANVKGLSFIGGTIGAYPPDAGPLSDAKFGIEYLGTSNNAIKFVGVNLPSDVFTSSPMNGNAYRWCDISDSVDIADTYCGGHLGNHSVGENLVNNPDLLNAANGWSLGAVAASEESGDLGVVGVLTPTTADTTQNVDYTVINNAEQYRGRKVSVSFAYQIHGSHLDKTSILRFGSTPAATVTLKANGEWNTAHFSADIGSAITGAIVIRLQVKSAGSGAIQHPLKLSSVNCIIK